MCWHCGAQPKTFGVDISDLRFYLYLISVR